MKALAVFVVAVGFGCSKSEPTPAPVASAPPASEPSMAKPEQPAPPPDPAAASAEPQKQSQPLSAYLSGAVAGSVSSVTPNPNGGASVKELKKLDEKATKVFLDKLDLTQKADGGLVRCPSDTVVELRDGDGKALGTIGFCGDAARFDAPDGTSGGIKAVKP